MQIRDVTIIDELEAIGRTRALTDCESRRLEEAVRSSGCGPSRRSVKAQRPWLPRDILALRRMVRQRKRSVEIADALNRTPHAVRQMMVKLRKKGKCGYVSPVGGTGRYPRKSLKADMGVEA